MRMCARDGKRGLVAGLFLALLITALSACRQDKARLMVQVQGAGVDAGGATFQIDYKPGLRTGNDLWQTMTPGPEFYSYDLGAPSAFKDVSLDDGGMFVLEGIEPGDLTLFLRSPDLGVAVTEVRGLRRGETREGVIIDFANRVKVTGTVRAFTGEPVSGALVGMGRLHRDDLGRLPETALARTDANGYYAFHLPVRDVSLVTAHKNGFAPGWVELPGQAEGANLPSIVLFRETRLVGYVHAEDRPVEDALFSLRFPPEEPAYGLYDHTDAHGRFVLSPLPPGEARLAGLLRDEMLGDRHVVSQKINGVVTLEEGIEQHIEIALPPREALVAGVVYRDGKPVAGAGVVVTATADVAGGLELSLVHWTMTQRDGRFESVPLPLGAVVVEAGAFEAELPGARLAFDLETPGVKRLDIELGSAEEQ